MKTALSMCPTLDMAFWATVLVIDHYQYDVLKVEVEFLLIPYLILSLSIWHFPFFLIEY